MFVAGGIGRGEAIAAYLEMGAVGVQLGTRFGCVDEWIPRQLQAFIRASAPTHLLVQIDRGRRYPGLRARDLRDGEFRCQQREVAQLLDEGAIEMAEAQLQIEHYWAGALRRAVIDGASSSRSLMAGQSVGMVHREDLATISRSCRRAAAAPESRAVLKTVWPTLRRPYR